MRRLLSNLALLAASLVVAVVIVELLSRWISPISPGAQRVTADGQRLDEFLVPGTSYRQVSSEFDALTTITAEGYRAPGVEGPVAVLFLGDSFTFGQGLSDEQTTPSLYADSLGLAVVNLGIPGSGTARQLDALEDWVSRHGPPGEVKLMLFAMTEYLSAGNDLADNLAWERSRTAKTSPSSESTGGWQGLLVAWRRPLLRRSNLVRVLKFRAGPALKRWVVPEVDEEALETALHVTETQLSRLDRLSRLHGFAYEIHLIHPIQDILRGSYVRTLERIRAIAPAPVESTADLFRGDPSAFYFPFDGHLNPRGSRTLASHLVERDRSR